MHKDDGGPAFPSEQHETQDGAWNQTYEPGMTLRDWFAGQALAGMAGNPDLELDQHVGAAAYAIADAMLAARKQEATRDAG